jgi:hypothetical protein
MWPTPNSWKKGNGKVDYLINLYGTNKCTKALFMLLFILISIILNIFVINLIGIFFYLYYL